MQPVLVDRSELATQALVEIVDDFGIALHGPLRFPQAKGGLTLHLERF
jgi:hypothetical protein